MKTPWFVAVVACIAGANACHGQEAVDKAKAASVRQQDVRWSAWPEDLRLLRASL